jgi:hypothetical protein
MSVGVMEDYKLRELRSSHTLIECFFFVYHESRVSVPRPGLSYTLRYVSLTELGHVSQFGLREPMHLCVCVSEEGGDGEGADSGAPSLLSYTLTYVNLACSST